jgi:hypothetical protein
VYAGLSAGLQLLDVASFSLALHRNHFAHCSVNRSFTGSINSVREILMSLRSGGNVYGGGVSVYIGGYSSSLNVSGVAVAAVGDTAVRNSSVRVETASFTSCSVSSTTRYGSNSYGGSFSLYLGAYAWSANLDENSGGGSSSTSGSTTASGVSVFISNVNSSGCSATTTRGNSYGGSFSFYLGAYAWVLERSRDGSSSSDSGSTTASGVSVFISNVNSSGCSATTTSEYGPNSYGGSFSLHLGAYAYSRKFQSAQLAGCASICGATNITGLVVSISSSTFANSSAASRAFHSAPLFLFPCAYSRSPAESRGGNSSDGEIFGSNVSAFAISTTSIIL